jgi:phenylalanyl-tRNA synthetase beta chain
MKYLYSWLKEYYPSIPDLDDLSDILIQLGHEIEKIELKPLSELYVAEIRSVTKHPNADSLSVVKIFDGTTEFQVVCGAPDLTIGQKVVFAPVNSTLPSGISIRLATIRGEKSEGMLCAPDELGVSQDHSKLYELPPDSELGHSVDNYIKTDAIIDLSITSNRGDVLSHFGLARDIAALIDKTPLLAEWKSPTWKEESSPSIEMDSVIAVSIHISEPTRP